MTRRRTSWFFSGDPLFFSVGICLAPFFTRVRYTFDFCIVFPLQGYLEDVQILATIGHYELTCPDDGTMPSCCMKLRSSLTAQCSTTFLSTKRTICICACT